MTKSGEEITQQKLSITISERKLVKMQLLTPHLIFENIGDTLKVGISINNIGNATQKVNIITRFFQNKDDRSFLRERLTIPSFSDTIVYVHKIVDRETLNEDSFRITVKGIYDDGNVFGTGYITANSVKNKRKFTYKADDLNLNSYQQNNQIKSSILKSGENSQYFLYANNQFEIGDGTFQSNIDLNYAESNNNFFVRNTWLQYTTPKYGVKAGNLYSTSLINLIGRGVEGYYYLNEANTVEAGMLHKSYSLIQPDNNQVYGKSAWATYKNNGGWEKGGYESTVLYDDDPNLKTRSIFASAKTSIINKKETKLRVGAAISNLSLLEETTENEIGGLGEVYFYTRKGRLAFSSTNNFSTGYFAGIRKGALNFIEKITYHLDQYNLWGTANIFKFNPKSISQNTYSLSSFTTQRYDVGISRRFNKISISLSPFYYIEKRANPGLIFPIINEFNLESKDISMGLNYSSISSKHDFSINFVAGLYNSNVSNKQDFHFRSMLNYGFGNFRLNTFYQHNYFMLGEVISGTQLNPNSDYSMLNIVPSYYKTFFKDKLHLQAGLTYSKNSYSDDYMQFNGRVDYELPSDFSVYFSTFYSDFSSNYYESSTMQFGVIKRFSKISVNEKRHNLKVFVYRVVETPSGKQKEPAAEELVFVNNEAFRTNNRGMIEYKKLPQGLYNIMIFNKREWYAPDVKIDLIDDMDVQIEMNKTVPVSGKIAYTFTDLSYEIPKELSNFTITLTDTNGDTFTTRTDNRGNFRIYVPEGSYTAQFQKPSRLNVVDIPDNNQFIEVKSGKHKNISFTLKIRERRVQRKKF